MKRIKSYLLVVLILLLISTPVYANFALFDAKELNIKVTNIDDPIERVELLSYGDSVTIKDVYGDKFDDKDFQLDPGSAVSFTEVEPYTKETYFKNEQYDKNQFYVTMGIYYTYTFSKINSSVDAGFNKKFNNLDELIEAIKNKEYRGSGSYSQGGAETPDLSIFNKELEDYLTTSEVTCEREITYTLYKLESLKEYPKSIINKDTLELKLTDFSMFDKYEKHSNYGFALRLYHGDTYRLILIGDNIIKQDSYIHTVPTVKDVSFDYQSNEDTVHEQKTNKKDTSPIIKTILSIIIAMIITIIIELAIAFVYQIKELKVVLLTNIITQTILHLLTLSGIIVFGSLPIYVYLFLEVAIVFAEYFIYLSYIKGKNRKELFLYSFVANACSFGLSLLINGFIK